MTLKDQSPDAQRNDGSSPLRFETFKRYYRRLVRAIGKETRGLEPSLGDPSDFAMSAFKSFLRGVQLGQYDPDSVRNVFGLLHCIALRKVAAKLRRQYKRDAILKVLSCKDADLGSLKSRFAEDPSVLSELKDEARKLVVFYSDYPKVQEVVILHLAGWSNVQIANRFGILLRTVQRRLQDATRRYAKFDEFARIAELKLYGASDQIAAEATETSVERVVFLRNLFLELWRKEHKAKYSSHEWLKLIATYFESGKIVPPDSVPFYRAREFSEREVLLALEKIAERWKANIFGKWRAELEKADETFCSERACKSGEPSSPAETPR